jgi:hypothetical protein
MSVITIAMITAWLTSVDPPSDANMQQPELDSPRREFPPQRDCACGEINASRLQLDNFSLRGDSRQPCDQIATLLIYTRLTPEPENPLG